MLNLFGGKKDRAQTLLSDLLSLILDEGGFRLSFQLEKEEENCFKVDIFGEDEGLLKVRRGRLLQAIKSYLLQVLYKEFPQQKLRLFVDSNGFWKEQEEKLIALTDQLAKKAMDSKKPVVFRQALSAEQRRLVHQRVAEKRGLKSLSFGEGDRRSLKLIPAESFKTDRK